MTQPTITAPTLGRAAQTAEAGGLSRSLILITGTVIYCLFFATFLYLIAFVAGIVAPGGAAGPIETAILVNTGFMLLFATQHTIMARPRFKAWITRFVPPALERSLFVLATCVVLGLTYWQWRPIEGVIWSVDNGLLRAVLHAAEGGGWLIALLSTFLLNHFELFGLSQVYHHWRNQPVPQGKFRTPLLYKLVRHPLMLGFLIAFWATPDMTANRLLWCVVMSAYICFGVSIEERDLLKAFGARYRVYKRRVPAILPIPRMLRG